MLHVWLIPTLIVIAVVLCGFYLLIKFKGGAGERSEGKTILHKPSEEKDLPPGY
jgi:hypothetical protein